MAPRISRPQDEGPPKCVKQGGSFNLLALPWAQNCSSFEGGEVSSSMLGGNALEEGAGGALEAAGGAEAEGMGPPPIAPGSAVFPLHPDES